MSAPATSRDLDRAAHAVALAEERVARLERHHAAARAAARDGAWLREADAIEALLRAPGVLDACRAYDDAHREADEGARAASRCGYRTELARERRAAARAARDRETATRAALPEAMLRFTGSGSTAANARRVVAQLRSRCTVSDRDLAELERARSEVDPARASLEEVRSRLLDPAEVARLGAALSRDAVRLLGRLVVERYRPTVRSVEGKLADPVAQLVRAGLASGAPRYLASTDLGADVYRAIPTGAPRVRGLRFPSLRPLFKRPARVAMAGVLLDAPAGADVVLQPEAGVTYRLAGCPDVRAAFLAALGADAVKVAMAARESAPGRKGVAA